jgi:hypothetical protein
MTYFFRFSLCHVTILSHSRLSFLFFFFFSFLTVLWIIKSSTNWVQYILLSWYKTTACNKQHSNKNKNITMELTAFWDTVLCSLVEIDRRLRGAYCLHHHTIPEGCQLHTRRRENLKPHNNISVLYLVNCAFCPFAINVVQRKTVE